MISSLGKKTFFSVLKFFLIGDIKKFTFDEYRKFAAYPLKKTGISIHIPFCKTLCPYCPSNRILYDKSLVESYIEALIQEIHFYAHYYPTVEVLSVHFGGGSPTILGLELLKITDTLRLKFPLCTHFSIEVNPADVTPRLLAILKHTGFKGISLGVQSFSEKSLQCIQRKYSPSEISLAIQLIKEQSFENLNVDLLFAMPNQSIDDIEFDLSSAIEFKPEQITLHPFLRLNTKDLQSLNDTNSFSYTHFLQQKNLYYYIYNRLTEAGYNRKSVWSFVRSSARPHYSLETRERSIGFGAGAGSYYEHSILLNTFSVPDYIAAVKSQGFATALRLKLKPRMRILYDFYWRLFETHVPQKRVMETGAYSINRDIQLFTIMTLFKMFGMVQQNESAFSLTKKGCLYIHLLQNQFSHRAVDSIWAHCKKDAWPQTITF